MVTTPIEKWWNDSFNRMADKWGASQHPGAGMPVAPSPAMRPLQEPIQGMPPMPSPMPHGRGQDPRLANVNLYTPGQRTEPFPEDSPMNLPEFWNTSRDWNKYPMTGDIPGEGGMSKMSPQQVAQIQKRQEMMEQFKRMITARRHAAMNP